MTHWKKLKNENFDDFPIESIDSSFYIPESFIDSFSKLIELEANSHQEKLERFNAIINISCENFSGKDISSDLTAIGASLVTGSDIELLNMSYIKTNSQASSDHELKTFIDDDKNKVLDHLSKNYGVISDEFMLAYYQSNIFGDFQGSILTNKRIIGCGKTAFQFSISEIKSIESGFWGSKINGKHKIYATKQMILLLKGLVSAKKIPFAFFIKHGSSNNLFENTEGRIIISRII